MKKEKRKRKRKRHVLMGYIVPYPYLADEGQNVMV